MLPRVKIFFENGALGSTAPSADGVVGLVATAAEVVGNDGLKLATPYVLRKLDDLVALGVTAQAADANAFLYRHVKEFYSEAGEGAELWLMGFSNTETPSDLVDASSNTAKSLICAAAGRIRVLGVLFNPADGYEPEISAGVENYLPEAMLNAQALAQWATNTLYAPLFVILEARGFNGNVTALTDLSTYSYNRVGVLLGDTQENSGGGAVGLLLGRIARVPVQRHIGRVRDLALTTLTAFIKNKAAELADVETINDKGYITFRTFTGKAGYFFADDSLATATGDDYRSIARRRTIDKAYRIAYSTLIEFLNDEIPITDAGELVPGMAKSWESEVEAAIIQGMTSEGNLGVDPNDPQDTGVKCFIDYAQKVVSTGKVEIVLRVKPYGYAKYIDVKLGFITVNQ
ncbi:MAG: DUF2586 family protein [Dysgonamonadaceae bacterium]|jgi:hypothetical protein|nr:DUF2586 family protein [Dysgonamonadaceae bacterium]